MKSTPRPGRTRLSSRFGLAILFCLVGFVAALYLWANTAYPVDRELFVLRATGYPAVVALALALLLTPYARARAFSGKEEPKKGAIRNLRRQLGIAAAVLSTGHAAFALASPLEGALGALTYHPHLRAGLMAWALLVILGLTSSEALIRLLRVRLWKELHRAVYVVALFAAQHLLLSPFVPRGPLLVGLLLFLSLWSLRFLPSRRKAPGRSSA